jgi:uncharacterized protein (TIGR03437 family)
MFFLHVRKTQALSIAAAALVCLAAAEKKLAAANPDTAPNVTYTATGTFSITPVSGADLFKLAGEPFSIKIVVNAALAPTSHGPSWAKYTKLRMTGTVGSGLEPTPVTISSGQTSIELATGNPSYDLFEMFAPVNVVGVQINVTAAIQMPFGTISKPQIHPFAAVTLGTQDTVVYTDPATGASTTLSIASGTLQGTIPGGGTVAPLQLHTEGAQVITSHANGTQSVRSVGAEPIDLGASSDVVALQLFASGVRDDAEIHVRIAGQDAKLLYAGPAGHFSGLDQISVEVPHSLAGSGKVDVALTVDGHTAAPVWMVIQ